MQSEYLADSIAESGGIGLADEILRSLLHQQEAIGHVRLHFRKGISP